MHEKAAVTITLAAGFLVQTIVTLATNGGGDLLVAYAPSTVGLLSGRNPYLTGQPWNTPYPPLFFLVLGSVSGIISLRDGPSFYGTVWSLRLALVIGHVSLAGLAYLILKKSKASCTSRVLVPTLILLLPSSSQMGEVWFHADVFGLLLLAGSILALQSERFTIGASLLSLAAAFKVHPLLALPLVGLWLGYRRKLGLFTLIGLVAPFMVLTIIPLKAIPGYYDSFVGANMQSRPSWSFSVFILVYKALPLLTDIQLPTTTINQLWGLATLVLFITASIIVSRYWSQLTIVDVVVLGLVVWLLPLRQVFHYYAFWAIVPFILNGRTRQALIAFLPFELSADLGTYMWATNPSWAISQDFLMVTLSLLDMMLLVGAIAACMILTWKNARSWILKDRPIQLTSIA